MRWETEIILWLQSLGQNGTPIYYINRFFTLFGEDFFIVTFFCIFYWAINKKEAYKLGLAACANCLSNGIIKNIVKRPRPWTAESKINNLKNVSGFSFPSGHSQNGAFLYFSAANYFKNKLLYILAGILVLCIMISRMYLGAHYPTDVLCGAVIGIIAAFVLPKLAEKNSKAFELALLIIPIPFLFLPLISEYFSQTQNDLFSGYGMSVGLIIGTHIERSKVCFSEAPDFKAKLLRVVIGILLLVGLNFGLKALLGLISDELIINNWLKLLKYAIMFTVLTGIYPMAFPLIDQLFKPNKTA